VHFEAPPTARLDGEIERFLERFLAWFEAPPAIDRLLVAGIAHLWFLTLHPFEDGNGRIARAIVDMALARADGAALRAASLSAALEAERRAYYDQLESQQRASLDITAWLVWFLERLDHAVERAEDVLGAVLHKDRVWRHLGRGEVNPRQRLVVNRLLDGFQGHLSTSKHATLAKCSSDTALRDTALRDIAQLVDSGILVRNPGGGRSTSYRLATYTELDDPA